MLSVNMSNKEEKHRQIKEYLWNTWVESDRYGECIVELDQYEIQGAKEVGERRWANNKKANTKGPNLNNKKNNTSARDVLGALGEMAAIKWLKEQGYEADMSSFNNVENRTSADDSFDTDIVFEGNTFSVEVKTTDKPINSKLIYPLHKGKKKVQPDVFLLVSQIDEKRHCIKGFTTSEKILNNIDDTLPNRAYAIHEKELEKDLENLLKDIKEK